MEPQHGKPGGVKQHDEIIVSRRRLMGAAGEQPLGISLRKRQLSQALEGDERQDSGALPHQQRSSSIPAQVKPGPKAVSIVRPGSPRARSRSSTNSTVGALILPQSFSTARSRSSVPTGNSSALSMASITLTPPGWQQKRSMSLRLWPMPA